MIPQEKSDSSGSSGLLASIFVGSPVTVNFFGFPRAFEPLEASLKIDDPTIKIIADYEPCVAVLGDSGVNSKLMEGGKSDRMN